jgi:hypothetical protein
LFCLADSSSVSSLKTKRSFFSIVSSSSFHYPSLITQGGKIRLLNLLLVHIEALPPLLHGVVDHDIPTIVSIEGIGVIKVARGAHSFIIRVDGIALLLKRSYSS